MVKTAWWDMDAEGRRLERIIKDCETKYWRAEKEGNHDMAESYFKRLTICKKLKQPYIQEVTGIRKILNLNDRRKDIPELSK